MVWKPRVTVAAIVEQNGKYLLVEEDVGTSESAFNQPAGHLENGESLIEAVVRETKEETGYDFQPNHITGIYRWIAPTGDTYLRVTFCGEIIAHDPNHKLDPDIISPCWLTKSEIEQRGPRLRSPLIIQCIQDYEAGNRYPLDILIDMPMP